ncbi:MAG TPA: O-methyltransferase [Chloroflexota bacterium]|jgi:predicted O-methyltransferase YrrM|nr:O-methyltransferase [Chloroflexota bacterium]
MSEQMTLAQYAGELYPRRDELLSRLVEDASTEGIPAIHIPDEIGRLLQVLVVSSEARRVLELGTLFAYSTIWMARVLPSDGRVLTLEFEPKHAEVSQRNLVRAGVADKVEIRTGPALESLEGLIDEKFDLIFIDADKAGYVDYLREAIRLSRVGTLIVADNTWRHGDVLRADDESGRAIAKFNRLVAEDPRLISTIIPTRDGSDGVTVATVSRIL